MSLREKQSQFALMVADLIIWAKVNHGWEVTFGEAFRSDEQAELNALGPIGRAELVRFLSGNPKYFRLSQKIANNIGSGIRGSLHEKRLAIDLNLFIDGEFQSATESYLPLGEYWESLGGAWGGRFSKPDGNHFSLEHEGVR